MDDRSSQTPIAIIGMGCMFPKARDLAGYWVNILNRVDGITDVPPTHWKPEDYFSQDPKSPDRTYAARGGFLSPVDFPPLEFGITPNALEAIDTTQLLGLMVAREALEDAGYGPGREFNRDRVSVILGVTGTLELVIPLGARLGHPIWHRALKEAGVEESVTNDVVQRIADSYVGWQEDSFPGLLGNVVAGRIANRLDLGGTNCVVDAACASSLSALHLATLELASGRCDMVLTGGLDTFNDIFMYMCFSKTPALSPTGDAKPFDVKADGTILGEGLGVLVLKRLADAERDGDKIYAVIRGIGSSSDGKGNAIYAPSPAGQAKALRQAYRLANIPPNTVELVEAHGTGTRAGDAAELTALNEVYRESQANGVGEPWCAVGSVKSQIGHTKAAAGAAGLMKAVLALHHKVLPPTIKVTQPVDLGTPAPLYVNSEKRPWLPRLNHSRRAAVSSFGFGGSNFHCVLEEYQPEKIEVDWDNNVQILAFGADTREQLTGALVDFAVTLPNQSWEHLRYSASCLREGFQTCKAARLLMVIEKDRTDVGHLIAKSRSMLQDHPAKTSWSTPDGLFFGADPAPGKLAFMFPGQGSQYVGMFRDLACQFPQMQEALSQANSAWEIDECEGISHESATASRCSKKRLSDFIYPIPEFSEAARARNEDALRNTAVTQPALGAVSRGALLILEHFGIQPNAVAGHSYGELVALHAAGRIDVQALCSLSMLRGRLMDAVANGSDSGAMLAVRAPLNLAQKVLADENLDLVIANKNAPEQFVLSGTSAEIERAIGILKDKKVDCKQLSVSAAFHSRLVAGVHQPLLAALLKNPWKSSPIPVFANTTGQKYPENSNQAQELLAGQLAQPVEFLAMIENMYQAGIRTFVEVGPSNKLTALIGSILRGRDHQALALDASSGKQTGAFDLARLLASLAAQGHQVHLSQWDQGAKKPPPKKPTLTIPICGANYVKPKSTRAALHNGAAETCGSNIAMIDGTDRSTVKNQARAAHQRDETADCQNNRAPKAESQIPRPSPDHSAEYSTRVESETSSPSQHIAPNALSAELFKATQENLLALQRLAEQTAQVHQQFLEGQDKTLQVFQTLLQRQQALFSSDQSEKKLSTRLVANPPTLEFSNSTQSSLPAGRLEKDAGMEPALRPPPQKSERNRSQTVLLEVVAEKTGYPAEMLELDMELDSDLGIDSIKRVEIFSALQERLPQAPPVKSEHLGTLRTLRQVVDFLASSPEAFMSDQAAQAGVPDNRENGSAAISVQASLVATHSSLNNFKSALLEVVAEKTGYPSEMLELDMELDADLGIDSIKRVEIFSALQERLPQAPVVKSEHLGTLRTLRQVVDFLSGSMDAKVSDDPARAACSSGQDPCEPDSIKQIGVEYGGGSDALAKTTNGFHPSEQSLPCDPTTLHRYVLTAQPLSPEAKVKPLSLPSGGEFWITNEGGGLTNRVAGFLEMHGFRSRLVNLQDKGKISPPAQLTGLIILAPAHGVEDAFIHDAFGLLKTAGPGLRQAGRAGGAMFVTVSRMDGAFGLINPQNPVSGGLAGFAKTAAKEWPEVRCKALDLPSDWLDWDAAAKTIVETLMSEGPMEIGLSPRRSVALELSETALEVSSKVDNSILPLERGDVIVVTGGARGVTAEAALALCRKFAPTLVLVGRSPLPEPEPDWLASLTLENEIKSALLAHAKGSLSPRALTDQYRRVATNRETSRNIRRIQEAGGQVHYHSLDIRDESSVKAAMTEIRSQLGPIRGLVHGAGVLEDRLIESKTAEQFEHVYSTKVSGLRALLGSLECEDLKLLVLFSSVTARFGRAGQIDYAAANEVLNKLAQQEARRRLHCRVVSLNWGPWDGGMVTPELKKIFDQEGMGLIPLQTGAEFLIREIDQNSDRAVEVVVMASHNRASKVKEQGLRIEANPPPILNPQSSIFDSAFTSRQSADRMTVAFERTLDVEQFPFLTSHVIDGKAVLPLAMTMEWLAHAALHSNPGLTFHGFDGLRVLHGVILEEETSCTVRALAGKALSEGSLLRVPVELRSTKEIDGKRSTQGDTLHARGEVILAARLPECDQHVPGIPLEPYRLSVDKIYAELLFHGSHLQGIDTVEGCSGRGIAGIVTGAPAPLDWIEYPLRNNWLSDPLVIDSAFQLMVLWAFANKSCASLPCFVGKYRQYLRSLPRDRIRVVAEVKESTHHRAVANIFFVDLSGNVVACIENYESVIDAGLNQAFRRNRLGQTAAASQI